MNDIAIRNVEVLDGLGGEAFQADVGIEGGRISQVGDVSPAKTEIDGKG